MGIAANSPVSQAMSLSPRSACVADVLNASTFTMWVSCGHGRCSVGWAVLRARADFVLSARCLTHSGSWAVTGLQNAAKRCGIKITSVFRVHATKRHLLRAFERKKNRKTRKEVREAEEGSFFYITSHPENMSVCFTWLFILHYDIWHIRKHERHLQA